MAGLMWDLEEDLINVLERNPLFVSYDQEPQPERVE